MEVSRTSLIVRRIIAYFIDHATILLIFIGLIDLEVRVDELPLYLGYLLYFPLFEWLLNGRTVGKFVCAIRVINGVGKPPSLIQTLLRGVTRIFEVPLGIITICVCAESQRCQRIGDMLAKTYVIVGKDLARLQEQVEASARLPG